MDLEKAYDRVDWLALWEVLRLYGVGGKLLSAIKSFFEEEERECVNMWRSEAGKSVWRGAGKRKYK